MNTTLLSKDYIANNGWVLLKTRMQDNELYWIGARGDYTPFVSWEGCVEKCNNSEKCDLPKYIGSGSISKCIDKCTRNYVHFALQGSVCFCLDGEQKINCIKTSSKDCGNPCLENPCDFCGGNDGVMTLYSRIKPDEVANEKANDSGGNCLVLLFRNKSITHRSESCFKVGRRYICKGPNGLRAEDYGAFITWQQAFDACLQKTGSMYYKMPYNGEYGDGTYFWTSLKRSISIDWTTTTHGSTKCVAVTKTNASTIDVRLENCMKKLQYLYVTDLDHKEEITREKEKSYFVTIIISVSTLTFITLCAVTGGLCFFRHQAKRKTNAHTQPVCPVDNNPQRQTEIPPRPPNPPFYHILETCNDREQENSAGEPRETGVRDVPTNQIYHTFAGVAQEEKSIYDTTTTSQKWDKRTQTRDGTIYGMRSAENFYDSPHHGTTTKKEIAPETPGYYELVDF